MSLANFNAASLRNLIKKFERRESLAAELQKLEAELASVFGGASVPAKKAGRKPAKRKAKAKAAAKAPKAAPKAAAEKAPKASAAPAKKAGRKGGRRGALKSKILAALKEAGDAGAAVRDLAVKLKTKPQNLHVWFSSTGKSVPGIQKLGEGRYKLS